MDRVDADLFLKDKKAGKIQHKNFVRIKAGESSSEKVAINIPFSDTMLFTEKRPDTLTVDALVYLSLLAGTTDISTPIPVHVKKDIPIPWDKIDKQVNSREDEIKSRVKKFLKK